MTRTQRCWNRCKPIAGLAFCLLCYLSVALWPWAYLSLGRTLTGRDLDLREPSRFDDGSWRDGARAWIYELSEADAATLNAARDSLRNYPRWCAGGFFDHKSRSAGKASRSLKTDPIGPLSNLR